MDIDINSVFVPFMRSKKRYQMLTGGRGGAKSHHAALKMIFGIMGVDPATWKRTTKPFRGVISRDTYENIRDGQYQDIKDLVKDYRLESHIHVGKSPFSFYCPDTGFNILAKATTQSKKTAKSKTKGIKDPTMVWIDELPDMEEEHFRKLTMSVRKKGADCQIICTHNTDIEPDHWVRRILYAENRDNTFYLHTTYKDNVTYMDKSSIEDYELMADSDPENYAVEVLGEWGAKKVVSPFAVQYDPKKHRVPCEFIRNIPLNISFDFNLDPFAFIYYQVWTNGDGWHFHIFEEDTIQEGSVSEACDRIRMSYAPYLHTVTITGDYNGNARNMSEPDKASNYKLIERKLGLNRKQFDTRPNPTHKNSRSDCNYILRHFPDLRINNKCVLLDRDLRNVEVDPSGKIIKANRGDDTQKADHLDAFRYACNSRLVREWLTIHQQT